MQGNRKLVQSLAVAGTVFVGACGFLFLDRIDGAQWVELSKWLAGFAVLGFGAGNALEHIAGALKGKE